MTCDPYANRRIKEMRFKLQDYVIGVNKQNPLPLKDRNLLFNGNTNLEYDGKPVEEYYSSDGVHLSRRGKEVILGNFRHHIHLMTRKILGKPERSEAERRSRREGARRY